VWLVVALALLICASVPAHALHRSHRHTHVRSSGSSIGVTEAKVLASRATFNFSLFQSDDFHCAKATDLVVTLEAGRCLPTPNGEEHFYKLEYNAIEFSYIISLYQDSSCTEPHSGQSVNGDECAQNPAVFPYPMSNFRMQVPAPTPCRMFASWDAEKCSITDGNYFSTANVLSGTCMSDGSQTVVQRATEQWTRSYYFMNNCTGLVKRVEQGMLGACVQSVDIIGLGYVVICD
jgi:hypothetical protein